MARQGGNTTQSGIFFQNSVTALYLGRLIDPSPPSEKERVIEVRAEAPEHVDDTVVRYGDGHRELIQAKENINSVSSDEAWQKLWQDFEKQRWDPQFGAEDRLVLAVGKNLEKFKDLGELCNRAAGAENEEEWLRDTSDALQKMLKSVRGAFKLSEPSDKALLDLLARVDVTMWRLDHIERDLVPVRMPKSNVNAMTLFRLLRDRVGESARYSEALHPSGLLRELQAENGVEIAGHDKMLKEHEPVTVLIGGEPFLMGSDEHENETPQHTVPLDPYWIGKYPVTNEQFAEFLSIKGRIPWPDLGWRGENEPPEEIKNHPVKGVTFFEALDYCEWLSTYTERTYRLPTEAEWEKAARATDGRVYPWGDEWQKGRCNQGQKDIAPVDKYPAQSEYGCCDLVGNVDEWTCTLWGENWRAPDPKYGYEGKDDVRNDLRAGKHLRRVVRGGSRSDELDRLRCSAKEGDFPDTRGTSEKPYGFRVALSY